MADMFTPAPEPETALGRYRVLSSTAGIRVSPLQLGAMSIGDAWEGLLGSMNKENSFKLLDAFYDAGGNFIDTANNYVSATPLLPYRSKLTDEQQDEQSETWIGEWMQQKQNRDMLVLATKFTTGYPNYKLGKNKTVNYTGNHKRSMHMSVRDSLKKLQTDYIDVLYVHWYALSVCA
jgi:aryl-alcohol dehydrogenase-like predicted oxidoreductase